MPSYAEDVSRLEQMLTEVQQIRDRSCEPKNNSNPRYLALSQAVTSLRRAAADMRQDL